MVHLSTEFSKKKDILQIFAFTWIKKNLGFETSMIQIGLQKAFNKTDHDILLQKLCTLVSQSILLIGLSITLQQIFSS